MFIWDNIHIFHFTTFILFLQNGLKVNICLVVFAPKNTRATHACKQHGGCSGINPNSAHQYSLELDSLISWQFCGSSVACVESLVLCAAFRFALPLTNRTMALSKGATKKHIIDHPNPRSVLWRYFGFVPIDGQSDIPNKGCAICKLCFRKFQSKEIASGHIQSLKTHLGKCHPELVDK